MVSKVTVFQQCYATVNKYSNYIKISCLLIVCKLIFMYTDINVLYGIIPYIRNFCINEIDHSDMLIVALNS